MANGFPSRPTSASWSGTLSDTSPSKTRLRLLLLGKMPPKFLFRVVVHHLRKKSGSQHRFAWAQTALSLAQFPRIRSTMWKTLSTRKSRNKDALASALAGIHSRLAAVMFAQWMAIAAHRTRRKSLLQVAAGKLQLRVAAAARAEVPWIQ